MPDRFGNPNFTDAQQVEFLDMYLDHFVGFEGTEGERAMVAEAWWMGDWSGDRCPSLEEARAFLAERKRAEACRWSHSCSVHGEQHRYAYVKERLDGTELWECECGKQAMNADDANLPLVEEPS